MTEHIFRVIEVSDDAYQMDYRHGEQAADLVQKYLLWIERLSVGTEKRTCTLFLVTSLNLQRRYCTCAEVTVVWALGRLIRYRLITLGTLSLEKVRDAT